MQDKFGKSLLGGICYREIQERDAPCEFCTNDIILENKGVPYRWEFHNSIVDRDFEIVDRIIKWPDGRDVRFEIALDVTERKRAEEKVFHLASFSNLNPNPIIETDLDGNPLYVNPSTRRIFPDLVEKGSTHPVLAGLKAVSGELEEEKKSYLVREVEIDRSYFQLTVYKVPDMKALRVYALDITKRKRAEKELREAKTQAELYLDLMGHDINNMHQVALGYLELAAELEENENMKELLERPRDVLLRSARLIDNVRKLQKLKNGTYLFRPIDLVRVLTDVVKEYEAVPGKVLMLDTHFINAGYVQANELLYDVFSNLVSNAVKYSGSHARVTIGLSAVLENGSHFYQVSVEDNGPGVPDSFKLKVFNRMLQGDAGAKGMGLGLYMVKTLVDSYQGRVWVENRVPGDHTKGAKFIVRLPALHKD
jgi:signal transduction histidine kinase